jgi:hypothetical protein
MEGERHRIQSTRGRTQVIWAKREFRTTDDYGPYQERFPDLHQELCGVAGMMMVKVDKSPHLRDVITSPT